jgi:hypothetical protein
MPEVEDHINTFRISSYASLSHYDDLDLKENSRKKCYINVATNQIFRHEVRKGTVYEVILVPSLLHWIKSWINEV